MRLTRRPASALSFTLPTAAPGPLAGGQDPGGLLPLDRQRRPVGLRRVRDDGGVAAVGMVAWRGEIVLNFVAPEAR